MDIFAAMFALCMLLPTLISGIPSVVTGNVYCDTCGAGLENEACSRHIISGAKVKFECKDRDTMQVKYQVEGLTDSNGTFNIPIKGVHEADICDSILLSSPNSSCAEDEGRNVASVILTDNYTANANANMGFLRSVSQASDASPFPPVRLQKIDEGHVVLDNGIVKVTLAIPQGHVTGIQYGGINNVLGVRKEDDRGYLDMVWAMQGRKADQDKTVGTKYQVVKESADGIELSFTSIDVNRPLNVDKRFILLRGSSGYYTYAIFERLPGSHGLNLANIRVTFKLNQKMFNYMAVSDTRQRFMPTEHDRETGQPLAYKEAVLLTNAENPYFRGEVDDKYQYSADIHNNRVHGWISSNPNIGFWVITPSNEFRVGGPLKQELTSHVGPASLGLFFSSHYAGTNPVFEDGEAWKKVFGPVFVYLNSAPSGDPNHYKTLWEDAKRQMLKETDSWPYDFPVSEDYPKANQRGTVSGRLLIRDKYINKKLIYGNSAYVGLAKPGEVRSWQYESKDYQFWTQADNYGNFKIDKVRAGTYNLFAWVPGFIGDYKHSVEIKVEQGANINLGSLRYDPIRSGPTIWEIGIPDRTASEFYVPDPNSHLINPLFVHSPENKFRQYGLWDRYTDLYPEKDLVFTVGSSDYRKDWFYAHVTRRMSMNETAPATWTVVFYLKRVDVGNYMLHVALAGASYAELQIRINDPNKARPDFTTGLLGRENLIARHGIHGLYTVFSIPISNLKLWRGKNAIYLKQSRSGTLSGLMYDYLRMEGPPL